MDIILGTIPRVYDNRQGDHTYQVQCNCRKNAVCSFSGYTLPSCMAAKQHLENASLRGRSGMMFGSKPIHSESFNINLNLVDLFNNKAVSIKASSEPVEDTSGKTTLAAPNGNRWKRLKDSFPANWGYCKSQINTSEWYCSNNQCHSICQGKLPVSFPVRTDLISQFKVKNQNHSIQIEEDLSKEFRKLDVTVLIHNVALLILIKLKCHSVLKQASILIHGHLCLTT